MSSMSRAMSWRDAESTQKSLKINGSVRDTSRNEKGASKGAVSFCFNDLDGYCQGQLSRCGICSRSDGTLGLSRRRWTLSNWR